MALHATRCNQLPATTMGHQKKQTLQKLEPVLEDCVSTTCPPLYVDSSRSSAPNNSQTIRSLTSYYNKFNVCDDRKVAAWQCVNLPEKHFCKVRRHPIVKILERLRDGYVKLMNELAGSGVNLAGLTSYSGFRSSQDLPWHSRN